ncbi:AMP-binding protein [Chitinophaga pendula]|uniref:condensation domain-containing protein n=1 Tax=Chitinophaga TaxID=79328 RepID=UPI000BAFB776|nr:MULTISPECIES: condensation domain-containing protein [Chitinophaga]ASZ13675.1 hypothetical protein CK934_23325 [Chitinophaga sp. MD30]UCJ08708.1 AMP-binding protein [Chitinophaga pendula]
MTFQHKLNECLQANPHNIAIRQDGSEITYAGIVSVTRRITNFLLRELSEELIPVGVFCTDRIEIITAAIGICNARCIFVPLDPNWPAKRLERIFDDLNLRYVITADESGYLDNIGEEAELTRFVWKDIVATASSEDAYTVEYPKYDPNDSLYIYFTSGTTGLPKGIVGKNASLLHFLDWEISAFGIDKPLNFSQFISPYFDAFLRDVFVPLFTGGTICIPTYEGQLFPAEQLSGWVNKCNIGFIHCVPSLFRTINTEELTADDYSSLKYVLLSGEKIIPGELKNWYKVFGSRIQLVNLYGATETTMIRSFYRILPADAEKAKIPVGKPISDTDLLILTSDFKVCSTLMPGDLYVVSAYMSKGYLNNSELTNSRFFSVNIAGRGETAVFKTGDKARKLADGNIDLIGREDRQVKLRGIRVELDAVEYLLCQSPFIQNAVVVKEEAGDTEFLKAFVVIKDKTLSGDIYSLLNSHLSEEVPDYMIPSELRVVDEFPLLGNGKIDIKALQNIKSVSTVEPPANHTEQKVLLIWKELLGDKELSVLDEFLRVGGNSIAIMSLIAKISKEFGVKIALSDVFKNMTVRRQADFIRSAAKDSDMQISKAIEKEYYNTSSSQARMYYNHKLNPGDRAYNLPMAVELIGLCEVDRLQHVIRALVNRHESLRTIFRLERGVLMQQIAENVEINIEELAFEDQDVDNIVASFIRPFDLDGHPLFRCALACGKGGRKVFVIDIHHIICDGLSQVILEMDFLRIYNREILPVLDYQYKDYAAWEFKYRQSENYKELRSYWINMFKDEVPRLQLPSLGNTTEMLQEGGEIMFEIEKSVINKISDKVCTGNTTLSSMLLSLYYIYLYKITGKKDIVIGVATSGRIQYQVENVVGMFVKTLPIRLEVNADVNYKEWLTDLHTTLVSAFDRQLCDLTDVISDLNSTGGMPVINLFETMFTFQNFEKEGVFAHNDYFREYHIATPAPKFPLSLIITEQGNVFSFRIEYSFSYFMPADMKVLAGIFKDLIFKVSNDTNATISSFITESAIGTLLDAEDISFNF